MTLLLLLALFAPPTYTRPPPSLLLHLAQWVGAVPGSRAVLGKPSSA
jgi:hypothetical protein